MTMTKWGKLIEVPAAWFALWALFEYGNYSCHATLRNMKLRSGGAKSAPAPDPDYVLSRAFELVSCPNYLYEVRNLEFTSIKESFHML